MDAVLSPFAARAVAPPGSGERTAAVAASPGSPHAAAASPSSSPAGRRAVARALFEAGEASGETVGAPGRLPSLLIPSSTSASDADVASSSSDDDGGDSAARARQRPYRPTTPPLEGGDGARGGALPSLQAAFQQSIALALFGESDAESEGGAGEEEEGATPKRGLTTPPAAAASDSADDPAPALEVACSQELTFSGSKRIGGRSAAVRARQAEAVAAAALEDGSDAAAAAGPTDAPMLSASIAHSGDALRPIRLSLAFAGAASFEVAQAGGRQAAAVAPLEASVCASDIFCVSVGSSADTTAASSPPEMTTNATASAAHAHVSPERRRQDSPLTASPAAASSVASRSAASSPVARIGTRGAASDGHDDDGQDGAASVASSLASPAGSWRSESLEASALRLSALLRISGDTARPVRLSLLGDGWERAAAASEAGSPPPFSAARGGSVGASSAFSSPERPSWLGPSPPPASPEQPAASGSTPPAASAAGSLRASLLLVGDAERPLRLSFGLGSGGPTANASPPLGPPTDLMSPAHSPQSAPASPATFLAPVAVAAADVAAAEPVDAVLRGSVDSAGAIVGSALSASLESLEALLGTVQELLDAADATFGEDEAAAPPPMDEVAVEQEQAAPLAQTPEATVLGGSDLAAFNADSQEEAVAEFYAALAAAAGSEGEEGRGAGESGAGGDEPVGEEAMEALARCLARMRTLGMLE
jgi:hypothetical protein